MSQRLALPTVAITSRRKSKSPANVPSTSASMMTTNRQKSFFD